MLDGSDSGEINALAITHEGEHCISGGEDKKVKIWDYDEGICGWEGIGHSGGVTKVAISPDQSFIVSVGSEGAIFLWHTPERVQASKADSDMPERPPSDVHSEHAPSEHHSAASKRSGHSHGGR